MAKVGRPRKSNVKRTPSGRATRAADKTAVGPDAVIYAVYFVNSGDRTKIGYTSNLGTRIASIESNSGRPAELLGAIYSANQSVALEIEAKLHLALTKEGKHLQGEWYRLTRAEVSVLLRDARQRGLKAAGGQDGLDDVPILSSLAYAAENILPINSFQGL